VTVATAGPAVLPDAGPWSPSLIGVDGAVPSTARERLAARFAGVECVELGRPHEFQQTLAHIASLAPELSRLRPLAHRLGPDLLALVDFVKRSYRASFDAAEAAARTGRSMSRLAHVVRDRLGMALMDYVIAFRFEVARHLLTATDRTLDDIAADAGFSSASHLPRIFLERAGLRPGDYRRRLRSAGLWPPRLVPDLGSREPSPRASPETIRGKIRDKLAAGELPVVPPPATDLGQFIPRIRSGVSQGSVCAACAEPIKPGDLMTDYTYPSGLVFGLHLSCRCLWDEERRARAEPHD
jgi:AraC-like DNA-binding protein